MSTQFTVKMTRQSAALYLHLEFGQARAVELLEKLIEVSPFFYRIPIVDVMFKPAGVRHVRKRDAEVAAQRIRQFIAYQQGRLGQPLTGGDVYVVPLS